MAIMLDWFTLLVVGKLGRRRLLFFGGLLTLLPILLGAIVFFSIWTPWMTLLEGLQGS